jgi:hypothetical protein
MNGVLAHSLAPYLAEQYCKIHLSAQKLCRRAKWAEKNETFIILTLFLHVGGFFSASFHCHTFCISLFRRILEKLSSITKS